MNAEFTFFKIKGPEGFLKINEDADTTWEDFPCSSWWSRDDIAVEIANSFGDPEIRAIGFVATQLP